MKRSAARFLVLGIVFGLATPALAQFGFGVEWGGGATVVNQSRLFVERGDERMGYQHGDGTGWITGPAIQIGYRKDPFLVGGEFGYQRSVARLDYDRFGGEDDVALRRQADLFRLGGLFQYWMRTKGVRPYVMTGVAVYREEVSLREDDDPSRVVLVFDPAFGGGIALGLGVDIPVRDKAWVGFGLRGDVIYFELRRYRDRLVDQHLQVPVGLFFRASFDREN